MATYSWFTIRTTAWRYVMGSGLRSQQILISRACRTRFRREANQADNKAATSAVDSLINYEAVKVRALVAGWKLPSELETLVAL